MKILQRRFTYYILACLILVTVSGVLLHVYLLNKQTRYFSKECEVLQIAYQAVLNTYAQTARTVYDEISQQPEIIDILQEAVTANSARQNVLRQTLYKELKPTYTHLQRQNISLFHFHLPDGTSFLRMHDPSKFSDKLFESRHSVKLVNTLQVSMNGFEVGKNDVGFRYVFPVFSNVEHLGSLEIGVSVTGIRDLIETLFLKESLFFLKKSVLQVQTETDDYTPSVMSRKYIRDNHNVFVHESEDTVIEINKRLAGSDLDDQLTSGKPFVMTTRYEEDDFLVTFLPIEDTARNHVAYLALYSRDSTIAGYIRIFHLQILGATIGIMLFIAAVYAVNRSRELISQSKDQLQQITDSMSEGLCVLNQNQRITFVNPAAEKILQYRQDELLGQDVKILVPHNKKDTDLFPLMASSLSQTGKYGEVSPSTEHVFFTKKTTAVPVETTIVPIRDNGKLLGSLMVFRDITRRKQMEEELQQSEVRYSNIFNAARDAFFIMDSNGYIVDVNPEACKMYGYLYEELTRLHRDTLVHSEYYRTFDQFKHEIQEKREQYLESVNIRKDGTPFHIELRGNFFDYKGQEHILAVVRDITLRKQAEEQLQRMNQQLQEASQHKSIFLANMSHELRTPLNAMIGYTSLTLNALKDSLPPKHLKNLIKAEQSSRTLLQLINDVLDFSKIEAGKMETFIEKTELSDVLEDITITAEGLLLDKPVELNVEYPADLPVINSDYTKLKQILNNLMSNAIKFTTEGYVALRATQDQTGHTIRIEVEDTGCGIPADNIEKIFESFKQVDGSVKKKFGGTGLGLAITRKLCRMLHIQIGVQSELGKGTTFWLEIPMNSCGNTDEAGESSHSENTLPAQERQQVIAETATETALCSREISSTACPISVEKSPSESERDDTETELKASVVCLCGQETHKNLQRHLVGFPLQVEEADTVTGCVSLARTRLIWAIILEPDVNGFESLTYLKSHPSLCHIPIIMCSTKTENSGFHLGALEYLTKPIHRKSLIEALMRVTKVQRGKILVVDDDPDIQELYGQYLLESGYTPHIVNNGIEALDFLKTHPLPQVIVLDLLMPEMDGFQVLEQIHNNKVWKQIPVVIVTGKSLSAIERQYLYRGTQLLLEKGKLSAADIPRHIEKVVQSVATAGTRSLLIVDDNEINLQLIKGIFEDEGYTVYAAQSGQKGIEIAQSIIPDTILMDLAMPELDGFEATKILKCHPLTSEITVIACSALSTKESKEKAFQAGCEGYITKPIEPDRFVEQVAKLALVSKIRRRCVWQKS